MGPKSIKQIALNPFYQGLIVLLAVITGHCYLFQTGAGTLQVYYYYFILLGVYATAGFINIMFSSNPMVELARYHAASLCLVFAIWSGHLVAGAFFGLEGRIYSEIQQLFSAYMSAFIILAITGVVLLSACFFIRFLIIWAPRLLTGRLKLEKGGIITYK